MAGKETKVTVKTHDGLNMETTVENYDAQAMVDLITTEGQSMVAIGDLVLHRTSIARVVPVKEK